MVKIAVVTVSDRVSAGRRRDVSGPLARDLLSAWGTVMWTSVAADGVSSVREAIVAALRAGADVVFTTGGTGVTSRDQTPEATAPLLTLRMEGIENLLRSNTDVPHAVLSRGVAGVVSAWGRTAFVLNAPGSQGGVRDAVQRVGPLLAHIVSQMHDGDHGTEDYANGDPNGAQAPDAEKESPHAQEPVTGSLAPTLGGTQNLITGEPAALRPEEALPSSHQEATWAVQNRGRNDGGNAFVAIAGVSGEAIDMADLEKAVDDASAGAVASFCGQVRNNDGARPVVAIDYEAHPDATAVVQRIADRVAAASGACKVAVLHRSGYLEVGDVALGAAVSASHRAEAFRVLEELVEQVKLNLPVWKCQHFADGTKEWTGAA